MAKNVLVTGASSGIGAATAIAFAKEGYNVGVNYCHREEGAKKTVEECKKYGVDVQLYQADVSDSRACESMLTAFIEHFGKIDVLVNNAGGALKMPSGGFDEIPIEYWNSQISLNLSAAAYCSRLAVRDMKQKNTPGRIINISSVLSFNSWSRRKTLPYSAAKAGINAFTRTLANEVAKYGICVNAVAPGFILTGLSSRYTEEYKRLYARKIPVGFLGEVQHITPLILFLADVEKTRFITGQVICCDGGESGDAACEWLLDEPI